MSTFELIQPIEVSVPRETGKYNTMLSNIHMDIGGSRNREQQDSGWIYQDDNVKICVIADGHGSVYGRVASLACIKACEAFFSPENIRELLDEPYKTLTEVFVYAHNIVKQDIIAANAKSGGTFEEAGDEVYIKEANRISIVDGGSTLTITVFTDEYIYTANVADSKTLLMTNDHSINQSAITILGDSAKDCGYNKYGEKNHFNKEFTEQIPEPFPETDKNVNALELTASHSPTDWKEFERLRNFRVLDPVNAPALPFANLQYPDSRNDRMIDIFTEKEGVITKCEDGYYYKNVCHEYASLFGSPESIRSLAMTRSIGDFYGISAGLSHRPEVRRFDLKKVFETKRILRESTLKVEEKSSAVEEKPEDKYVAVVMGSDGIWDNWTDEDTNQFIFYPTCIDAVVTKGKEGVNAVAKSFSDRNRIYGNRNFGVMSDNAICIVAMIHEC